MAHGRLMRRRPAISLNRSRGPSWLYSGLVVVGLLLLIGCRADPTPLVSTASPPITPSSVQAGRTPTAPVPTSTVRPTDTPIPPTTPTPLLTADWIAFETDRDGNSEIYLLDSRSGRSINLTRHPAEDRAPAWNPRGDALAFESNRDGNWEIYLLDLLSGLITRLTDHPAYDGAPAWSPDGSALAFESYRDGNLEIYVLALGSRELRRLTQDPAGDYGPAWSPDGKSLAFTSWRDGNKEIYLVSAQGGEARNLTEHPADDQDPIWLPDGSALAFVSWREVDPRTGNRNAEIYRLTLGDRAVQRLTRNPWPDLEPAWDPSDRLVWSAYDPGPPFETYDPYRPGDYHLYRMGPEGPERLTDTDWDDRHPAPAPRLSFSVDDLEERLPPPLPSPEPTPFLSPGTLARVVEVPSITSSDQPITVNELVAPSLVAWQEEVLAASGWDFLRKTLGSWRNIDSVRKKKMYRYDYGFLSWHKAGRALDLALEFKVDGVDQMLVVREDLGDHVYWRLYLRAALQDGTQGKPLKDNPWLFWWHIVPDQDAEAYNAGGKRLPIPDGYYVDITALAKRHGWERIASYAIVGDYHWQTDSNGTEYWHYERTDGLQWWEAMRQIYPLETLEQYVGWEAGLQHAQSEEMMRSKGIPIPTP
ncbi:MAG: TolB family protein [Anaerolineae bacterium]